MTASTLVCAGAAALAVVVTGWRWQPPPDRCRAIAGVPPARRPRPGGGRSESTVGRRRRPAWRRRPSADASVVADWCDGLSAALRSGSTLAAAIHETDAPPALAPASQAVRRDIRRGSSLAESMRRSVPADPDARSAWVVVTAVADHGGPAAEALDRAAGALRARHAERLERRTQSANARLSARVMTVLPVAMLALLVTTSAPVRDAVVTPIGSIAVAAGVACNVSGWLWMRRLVARAAR